MITQLSSRVTILVAALTVGSAFGQTPPISSNPGNQESRQRRAGEADPVESICNLKRARASAAMEARDYALAERLYEEVIDLVPTNPFEHVHLARLYDRMGRGRDALKKYRTVVKGSPGAWSSLQSDPSLLARYGDLCSKFGPVAEAATAYMSAVESSDNRVGQNGIQIAPPDRTLLGLRAAAHVAAGAKFRGQGDVGNALREYDLALAALPNWWVALTFRGEQRALRVGMEALARSDFARAESLATGADRELVRKSAKLHGVITGKSSRN